MTSEPGRIRLVLLRHGRSRADDEGVHEGRYDSPLTEVGRTQAARLADHWRRDPPGFDRVVCSPLVRAHETALIVSAALGLEPEVSPLWMEHDNGPLAGLPFDEAGRRYPVPAFRSRWAALTPDGGESVAGLERRAGAAVEEVLQGPGRDVLVVAHGNVLNAALRELTGAGRAHFAFGDTGFAEVIVRPATDTVFLLSVGRAPHLDP